MHVRSTLALAALVSLLVGATTGASAASATSPALQALSAAESIFRDGDRDDEATLALRDLALAAKDLPAAERRRAEALLDRPAYSVPSRSFCVNVCLHWVESTPDAPPLRDANANRLPDWVETTMGVLEEIWAKEIVQIGFRPPKSDLGLANHGPDGRLDVYLKDIADEVLGYCAPDVPPGYAGFDVPGHCVLDDDYSLAQLGPPAIGGRLELQLTAAHEFFHAVQFGYDAAEDGWLLEGTATWIEDEVYDALNEPHVRFPYSPILHPEVPLDTFSRTEPFQYGSWVFWRFLEEIFSPEGSPRDPTVIRRVWELADASANGPDLYSLAAVEAVARERGSSLRSLFAAFGVVNAVPTAFYEEGRQYPSAPPARSFTLSRTRPGTGAQRLVLDHMTNRHISLRPGAGVRASSRLALSLDLPGLERGSEASLITISRSRAPRVTRFRLDMSGAASLRVPFAPGTRIVLVLTNASSRYRCYQRTRLACEGVPLDDDQTFRFRATLVR